MNRRIRPHVALAALMAQAFSLTLPPCLASRRNQKKVSIYLSFYRARAVDRGCAISAISAVRSVQAVRVERGMASSQTDPQGGRKPAGLYPVLLDGRLTAAAPSRIFLSRPEAGIVVSLGARACALVGFEQ
jgi:hypothetical protein